MLEKGKNNLSAFHLAGIIPVSGLKDSFGMLWHPCMNPISHNYSAIERAVVECAYAGCETIWVICDDDTQPLIKERLGDYILDPSSVKRSGFAKYPSEHRRDIPIFYTPIHPKNRDKRDSLIWAAMHGALSAFVVSSKISKWLVPSKYYVCFPYGVYDPSVVYNYRKIISSNKSVLLASDGHSAKSGDYMSFSFDSEQYKQCVYEAKKRCTGGSKMLPVSERWSSKDCSIKDMLQPIGKKGLAIIDVEWYYAIDSWEKYHDYLSSPESRMIKKPSESVFKVQFYNKIQELGE